MEITIIYARLRELRLVNNKIYHEEESVITIDVNYIPGLFFKGSLIAI